MIGNEIIIATISYDADSLSVPEIRAPIQNNTNTIPSS